MSKGFLAAGMVMSALSLAGCIIVSDEREHPQQPPKDVTILEIDAVSKMALESSRLQGYERIAKRAGLSDATQAYLVEAVFEDLSLESSKLNVLLTLIRNPGFRAAGERAMLENLDKLALESSKRMILDAINRRKTQPV
ncbi:MAG: hypothetical protein ACYTBJ_16065 [Planctomycetota bacterium]